MLECRAAFPLAMPMSEPGHYRREPGGDKCVQAGTDENTVSVGCGGSDFLLQDTCCILQHLHLGHFCNSLPGLNKPFLGEKLFSSKILMTFGAGVNRLLLRILDEESYRRRSNRTKGKNLINHSHT